MITRHHNLLSSARRGFTLIELLVVIAIIGILSGVVLANIVTSKTRANYARAKLEMRTVVDAIQAARWDDGGTLADITGVGLGNSSDYYCLDGETLINDTGTCYTTWITNLSLIRAHGGGVYDNITELRRDPWNSPYVLHEGEFYGDPSTCSHDTIKTAGPDGIAGTSDDSGFNIPYSLLECSNSGD